MAEAELELRRVRRAQMLLAEFPPRPSYILKMVESPNSKLFNRAVARMVRRKNNDSFDDLSRLLYNLGWDPDAPNHILVPTKRHLPILDPRDFFERYEKRARSKRKFAIRDFDRASLKARED